MFRRASAMYKNEAHSLLCIYSSGCSSTYCTYVHTRHWLFAYNFLSALCSLLKMCLNAYSISRFTVLLFTHMH